MPKKKFMVHLSPLEVEKLPPEDPVLPSEKVLSEIPLYLRNCAVDNYHWFRTSYARVSRYHGGIFVIRQPLGPDPIDLPAVKSSVISVLNVLPPLSTRFNISFGLFMEDVSAKDPKNRFHLFYPSRNNFTLFESALFLDDYDNKEQVLDRISYEAVSDHLNMARRETNVRVRHVAAVMINAVYA